MDQIYNILYLKIKIGGMRLADESYDAYPAVR
jgi:hypothetical protein